MGISEKFQVCSIYVFSDIDILMKGGPKIYLLSKFELTLQKSLIRLFLSILTFLTFLNSSLQKLYGY